MTSVIILALLSLCWHLALTRWVARAASRALRELHTLNEQIESLKRMEAHVEIMQAGIRKLADIERERAGDETVIRMLRNFKNN